MAVAKKFQPVPVDAGKVLLGVAQVRLSPPSVRAAGTAVIKAVRQVPDSTISTVTGVDGSTSVKIVVPSTTLSNTGITSTLAASGTYTGTRDGAFIIRVKTLSAAAGATADIFSPTGYVEEDVALPLTNKNLNIESATTSGVLVSGNVTAGGVVGQTFIIPVVSGSAQDSIQTNIICPYSIFSEANESAGALRDSKFSPKVDSQEIFEAGFPAETYSSVITKTSVAVSFTASEFSNTNIDHLRSLMSSVINDSKMGAVACEIMLAASDGTLYSYYVPSAKLETFPEFAPTNSYSAQSWSLNAARQTQVSGGAVVSNTWLTNTKVFYEGDYEH